MNTLYLICTNGINNNFKVCNIINKSQELQEIHQLTAYDKQYYNEEVYTELEIREDQLDAMLNIIQDKSIALEIHAKNIQDVFMWSRDKFVVVLSLVDGDYEYDTLINNTYNDIYKTVGVLEP